MKYLTTRQMTEEKKLGGRSTIYRHVSEGLLPQPLKVGCKNLWIEAEVDEYLARAPRARINTVK